MAGSAAGRLQQLFQLRPRAFGDELDRPVVAIPHPAAQSEAVGLADEEVAKSDPLHIATNDAVQALHSREVICCWPYARLVDRCDR